MLPFYQFVHLATLAGIGRAAADSMAAAVYRRARSYSHGAASETRQDPQILQVVGRVRGAAYSAGAIVLKAAEAVERAADANGPAESNRQAVVIAELEAA